MKRARFTEEQFIVILAEHETGQVKGCPRQQVFSCASGYRRYSMSPANTRQPTCSQALSLGD